jgi:glycosyltransferase involved in cell wall biosynthesis
MKVSVIMPCSLEPRRNAADDLPEKFKRAVRSYLNQTYGNSELIIVADGCAETVRLFSEMNLPADCRLVFTPKQRPYSGLVRNAGLHVALGDVVCYLDADDKIGERHLENIVSGFAEKYDWVFFDDYVHNGKEFVLRPCEIKTAYRHGTANIAHRNYPQIEWKEATQYGQDDLFFIRELRRQYPAYAKISGAEYFVMHIPKNNQQHYYDL